MPPFSFHRFATKKKGYLHKLILHHSFYGLSMTAQTATGSGLLRYSSWLSPALYVSTKFAKE